MVNECYNIQNYQAKLDYGDQFLNERYSIAVVFLKTVNLTTAWQLDTELFTKRKAGLIIKKTVNKYDFANMQTRNVFELKENAKKYFKNSSQERSTLLSALLDRAFSHYYGSS